MRNEFGRLGIGRDDWEGMVKVNTEWEKCAIIIHATVPLCIVTKGDSSE
jgi:hypothetical protein